MPYSAIIFDIDYYSSLKEGEKLHLTSYIEEHGIKVAIVTNENKPIYTRWLKNAIIRPDYIIGGGDLKKGRFKFIRKPEPQPMLVAAAHLGKTANKVLAICTKAIDREAAEAAGISYLVNPTLEDTISQLSDASRALPCKQDLSGPVPKTGIYGAVCGDIIGTPYEHRNSRMQKCDFEMFAKNSHASDDTVLTMAIARWLMGERTVEQLTKQLVLFAYRHYRCGFGHGFLDWLNSKDHSPRVASSNGSAMRVSPVAYAAQSLEETLELARIQASLTHNSPDGVHGAQAIAACVYLARTGKSKEYIQDTIHELFGFDLNRTIAQIRSGYDPKADLDCNCVRCASEAIICWLQSESYEATIRNAISLGGDADTIAAMAGAIAAATPGMEISEAIANRCYCYLSDDLKATLLDFENFLSSQRKK